MEPGWRLLNPALHSSSLLPLLAPVGRPFVLTGVTRRHQLPIRQCNIRPILPVCDWEILEWSKATNLIYTASINKEIVPSLIALLNNGCLFGNHFPISCPTRTRRVLFLSLPFLGYIPSYIRVLLKQPNSDEKIHTSGPNQTLCLFDPNYLWTDAVSAEEAVVVVIEISCLCFDRGKMSTVNQC